MRYTCIIIEDEYPARVLMNDYVSKIDSLTCLKIFRDSRIASSYLQKHRPDILFADIQMPGMSGIELIRTLSDPPKVIFTTAYPDYAVEGFELSVTDFLVKPFRFERFLSAVNKAIESIRLETGTLGSPTHIKVRADQKIYLVNTEDILFIEGFKEYVRINTAQKKLITLESLKNMEQVLPENFIRIHRSYIINRSYLSAVSGQQVQLRDITLPVGKTYRRQVMDVLLD